MPYWSVEEIDWSRFDPGKVTPMLVSLAKAASMVEHNAADYARYLCDVFPDDPQFKKAVAEWAEEETQHGEALRRWAEHADPDFDFEESFAVFTKGFQLPHVASSVRGSRCGELIARCVVETGTSSYYTAIMHYAEEPVLKAICANIAADEFRHYKLFYTHLKRYLKKENLSAYKRLAIALERIAESEDDELAYAFFASHPEYRFLPYDRNTYKNLYLELACRVYRKEHIDRMTVMVLKAIGIKPHQQVQRAFSWLAWQTLQWRGWLLKHRTAAPAVR
jgi:rubrerythrin